MTRLASIALLGTLALLTSNAQSQMRGGGGAARGGGGGDARASSPAPHVSSSRPMSSGPTFRSAPSPHPSFNRGPSINTRGVPVNNSNSRPFNGRRFSPSTRVFFNDRDRRFHTGFFRNRNFFNNGFFGANCFGNFAFGNPFCGNFVGFLFGDPFFGLGFGDYGYPYSISSYPPPPYYYPQQNDPESDPSEIVLARQIQHLNDEIDDLRDDRNRIDNRDQQPQERSQSSVGTLSAVPPAAYTVFVLRDGRRLTAQNYAISGQTLWILNEHSARKTSLSEIDRAATEKANAANGIEIHLPEPE